MGASAVRRAAAVLVLLAMTMFGMVRLAAAPSCDADVPEETLFGSSISTAGIAPEESMRQVDSAFGRVPVVRAFDPGLPAPWDSRRARATSGRTMVQSFRIPPLEVLSGQHDTYLGDWFASAPDDQVIYWSYLHEPESLIDDGQFSAAEYRAAWAHLRGLADAACKPKLFATLILTGWTATEASGRNWTIYDAGPDVVDVLAFDPYNGAGDQDRAHYEPLRSIIGPVVELVESDGRPWGIAETGSRLAPWDDGAGRAAWLSELGDLARSGGASFVTYFQSTRGGDWRLDDSASRAAWADLVAP
jgi:hypothetical protein